jgi:hypothetical protein
MQASLALVHHANQYLITNGYDNREGLTAVLGTSGSRCGLAHVLDLHARHGVPLNLHISGTLLEAIAWHQPEFLAQVREMLGAGLIELVGSSYGQNIMRFFGADYNRRQLNEELLLYDLHLGVEPERVRTFWPPERVWETRRMAPVVRDARLLNNGYRHVILDDRLLLSPRDAAYSRSEFDEKQIWSPDLFKMHEIEEGFGLTVFPIATRLRRSIPPRQEEDWRQVQAELEALLVHATEAGEDNLLAVYADDMEKVAGVWGMEPVVQYERFLEWLAPNGWIRAVRLCEWAGLNQPAGTRRIETGTFAELANEFDAGEGYERWYLAADWAPYRGHFTWSEKKVQEAAAAGGDRALLALAEKQLLVSNWETAWHTPATGAHGDPNPDLNGQPSPWARALASHSRHAGVIAEAALWMRRKDGQTHVSLEDIDNDGTDELVLKNDAVFAVISPGCGGRLVALFHIAGERGAMMVGNPCDDWNFMEELNRFMEVPRNHPGCFADVGFENDPYTVVSQNAENGTATATLAAARGLRKQYSLSGAVLSVRYSLPTKMRQVRIDCGLSPDYLTLLRAGTQVLDTVDRGRVRGCATHGLAVCLELPDSPRTSWSEPPEPRFGHGVLFRVHAETREFELRLHVADLHACGAADTDTIEDVLEPA